MNILKNKIKDVTFITIGNNKGMEIALSTFGASIYDLKLPDYKGNVESIVLTPSNLNDFYNSDGYFGKTIGRFSGRIKDAKCVINGIEYTLDKNWNNNNSLHGGFDGISFKNFEYKILEDDECVSIIFTYFEKENKLPGDVNYKITYQIQKNINEFAIYFNAITSKDTLLNLTNHTYFNLSGDLKESILNHDLQLLCDKYSLLDENLIPISFKKVNKVMDFTNEKDIKSNINDDSLIKHTSNGYDHCFLKENIDKPIIAILKDKKSKRNLTISTSYPSIVCYTYNYPKEYDFTKNHIKVDKNYGIALECQFIPNDVSNETILKKNQEYNHYIKYNFSIKE